MSPQLAPDLHKCWLQFVFKIVPLEGSLLVNGETQKRSEEILAEVAIALTLSRLREPNGRQPCMKWFAQAHHVMKLHFAGSIAAGPTATGLHVSLAKSAGPT